MADNRIEEIYKILIDKYGTQDWWPAESKEEIIIGAVLTQNTNWKNVEKALNNLKSNVGITFENINNLELSKLAELIKPSGYYNQKAERLKIFADFIRDNFKYDLNSFLGLPLSDLRETLLSLKGIGPETADDIILYAAGKPVFVIDAYTIRIFSRHGICSPDVKYHDIQSLCHDSLPRKVEMYKDYHALLIRIAKEFCSKRNPKCEDCPLNVLPLFLKDKKVAI